LSEEGLALHVRGVGNFRMDSAREAALKMFSRDPPDAVFVANDHMAIAVMDTLRYELGIKVSRDVSVVGYDDVPAIAWPTYNLTTVRQRSNIMVLETVEILLNEIEEENAKPRKVKIDGPLILRGSAKIPDGWHFKPF